MKAIFEDAKEIEDGVFDVRLNPTDAQRLEGNPVTKGARSVVLAEGAQIDSSNGLLIAEICSLRALAIGTGNRAVVINAGDESREAEPQSVYSDRDAKFDAAHYPGDREFLREAAMLPAHAEVAIRRLLGLIRSKSPGSMKRGSRRNFSNQPDNFWYAVIQPVRGNVSVTVRGRPENFRPSTLDLKMDRPGYTRFYLSEPSQVDEAFRIISASKRRK